MKTGAIMNQEDQELKREIQGMWDEFRSVGDMVVDFPAVKLGMPFAVPFSGVCFPAEEDGNFVMVSIPPDEVARFAFALLETVRKSKNLDSRLTAGCEAYYASQAKGRK